MKKLHNLFFVFALLLSSFAFAQQTITGKVLDQESMPLPGASVVVQGTTTSATTDSNGVFTLSTDQATGTVVITYVGYANRRISFTATQGQSFDAGTITLTPDSEQLEGLVIIGGGVIDLVEDRKTPVAVSTISRREIQEKSGNQEFPEVMKNTPSIYIAGAAGGAGDAQMYTRGFDQTNTAFLLNGQPINGMEDGNMYWSNWSGMTDVANAVQVQRGLGSSKLAISSVGGTINIVTKATDLSQGGFAQSIVGNDNYMKHTVGYNTGLMESGWGVSAMVTKWSQDGYNRGTFGEGQNYFVSVGYKLNDAHRFNFLIFGAPQWHDQNYTKRISDYLKYGRKYNNNYGYLDGDYLSERRNYYHKPVANLNWDFKISDKMDLSTVLYASWGRGGGTGNWGNGRVRTADGHINFNAIRDNNMAVTDRIGTSAAYALRNSVNNHAWYGIVSNFNYKMDENLSFNVGVDLRTYKGDHYRNISNFLGLAGFAENGNAQYPGGYVVTEQFSANPWSAFADNTADNQKVNYDYSERITYGGLFGQVEYAVDGFSVYAQGAVSNQSHIRWDRYGYVAAEEESPKVNNVGYNVKGGASYTFADQHTLFANAGYYSKQPYHDNIYLNFGNDVNPLTENEKITGLEAGYRFTSQYFSANLNAYMTRWKDRVTTTSNTNEETGQLIYTTNSGVNQLHKGLELDFVGHVLPQLDVRGFASVGDWTYDDNVFVVERDEDRNILSEEVQDVKGGKVGPAAQTSYGLGVVYRIGGGFSFDADWRNYDDMYADVVTKNNIMLPSYDLVDAGLTYKLNFTETSLSFRLNVNNVFDEVYLSEMTSATAPAEGVETYKGINVNNNVFFGNGRTWNFGMRFNF